MGNQDLTRDLLTPDDAAEQIGISRKTMREYMTTRRIGYVLVNGRRYLTKDQVDEYIRNRGIKVVQPVNQ